MYLEGEFDLKHATIVSKFDASKPNTRNTMKYQICFKINYTQQE